MRLSAGTRREIVLMKEPGGGLADMSFPHPHPWRGLGPAGARGRCVRLPLASPPIAAAIGLFGVTSLRPSGTSWYMTLCIKLSNATLHHAPTEQLRSTRSQWHSCTLRIAIPFLVDDSTIAGWALVFCEFGRQATYPCRDPSS
jgi:hypothetical protein